MAKNERDSKVAEALANGAELPNGVIFNVYNQNAAGELPEEYRDIDALTERATGVTKSVKVVTEPTVGTSKP